MTQQMELVRLDELVNADHPYRVFQALLPLAALRPVLVRLDKTVGKTGFGSECLFLCLLLQFMEDVSDRECERLLRENMAAKWFCGFGLTTVTPDHTVFCKARKRLGTKRLSECFALVRDHLKAQGYLSEVFTFVDATHLISKANLWRERDQAIKTKHERLNNEVLPKVAIDPQARIGCKGQDKYWYGYKQHTSVDMQSGLIDKVAITPANTTDAKGLTHICPRQGAIYADKGYCTQPAKRIAAKYQCHLAAVKKRNMTGKNKDQDRWYTHLRSPYERVFSKQAKRVRYRGIAKNQFAAFLQAMAHNLKRLAILNPPPKPCP